MKYQTRFQTLSGSTYVFSYMTGTLYKVEGGSRTALMDDVLEVEFIHVGHRPAFCGRTNDVDPVTGHRVGVYKTLTTSRVVSVGYEPDWCHQDDPGYAEALAACAEMAPLP